LIGHEEDVAIGRRASHNLLGVAARADDVGKRLHAGAAIDVGDDVIIFVGVLVEERLQFVGRAGGGKRTAGVQIRQEDTLRRVNDFRRLRHEVHSAKEDDIGVRLGRLITQA
jgi:hypothetical protein